MKRVAIGMARDEADIIGHTVQHLLNDGFDMVVVADNLSVDCTPLILKRIDDPRLVVIQDTELAYHQADKVTAWAEEFCNPGDLCVPFDADEIWWHTADCQGADVYEAPVRRFIPTPCDSHDPNPLERIRHYMPGDDGATKVCFTWQPGVYIHQGAHNVDHPGTRRQGPCRIDHYQYRSRQQARRKVVNGTQAYEASELPDGVGFHWRNLAAQTDEQFDTWWDTYTNWPGLVE